MYFSTWPSSVNGDRVKKGVDRGAFSSRYSADGGGSGVSRNELYGVHGYPGGHRGSHSPVSGLGSLHRLIDVSGTMAIESALYSTTLHQA